MIFSQELYIIPFLRSLMAVSIFYSATCMTIFLRMLGKVSGYAWVFLYRYIVCLSLCGSNAYIANPVVDTWCQTSILCESNACMES
jgi:hypothetical protein